MKTGYVIEKGRTDGFKVWLNHHYQWDEWRMNRHVWRYKADAEAMQASMGGEVVRVSKNDQGAWCTPAEVGGDRRVS
ncbi:MAG: hypothetical protein HY646_13780 [Acidobacteria bacterium]|nr:hypothetical protein [Acidobacteriota bacterium]